MKVLHMIDSSGLYGAETMLLDLMQAQRAEGLQVMLLASCHDMSEPPAIAVAAKKRGLEVKCWSMPAGFLQFSMIKSLFALLRWIRAQHFSLLHSHGYKLTILLSLSQVMLSRLPPLLVTLHGDTEIRGLRKMALYQRLNRLAFYGCGRVICVSPALYHSLSARLRQRVVCAVIDNGINIRRIEQCAREDLPATIVQQKAEFRFCAVAIGRLSYEKGWDRLLAAFSETDDDMALWCVGDGPEREYLQLQCVELGIQKRVFFLGFQANPLAILRTMDGLIIASRSEGLPMVLLEAMVLKVPLLATNVGSISHVLENGRLGCIIDNASADNTAALAQSLVRWSNDAKRMTQAVAARDQVKQHYASAVMAASYYEQYCQMLLLKPSSVYEKSP